MLIIIWAVGILALSIELFVIYVAVRRIGKPALIVVLLAATLVWLLTPGQSAFERALSVLYFPWTFASIVLQALMLQLWPALFTSLVLGLVAFLTWPTRGWRLGLWFLLFAALFAELPFIAQNAWTRPRALEQAKALGLENVYMPHFADAVRLRLSYGSNWLINNNGQGWLDGELYLWSYQDMNWYLYDPNWWRT